MRILVFLSLFFAAQLALATLEKAGQEFDKGNYAEAAALLLPLAEGGEARAQTSLGSMYSNGLGVPRDLVKAVYWTRKAADSGNPRAQANLGLFYMHGIGLPQDDRQAVVWLSRAADQGNAGAQNTLGVLFQEGRGVQQDYVRARNLFDAAIRGGEVGAANNLARMIEQGLGAKPDLKAALGLFEIAANGGDPAAQNRVGLAYLNGELRQRNRQRAKEWFQKSAAQGERHGQFHLGKLLMEENAADPESALLWISLSARQGHAPAQAELDARIGALNQNQRDRLQQLVSQWRPIGRGAFDPAAQAQAAPAARTQPSEPGPSSPDRVLRPTLGLTSLQNLTPELAQSFGLSQPGGALIVEVRKEGPAAQAGILAGDIVLRIGSEPIRTASDVAKVLSTLKTGEKVIVEVYRSNLRRSEEIGVLVAEFVAVAAGPARARSGPTPELTKARLLYSCFHFFSEGSREAAEEQKEKLRRIANQFLMRATSEVAAADTDKNPANTELAQRIGAQGKTDFRSLMDQVDRLPTQTERNQRIGQFANSCSAAIGVKQ